MKMVDRSDAIKSVRSLSKTIDDLIHKEKEAINDHYQSKLSRSKLSSMLEQSKLGSTNQKCEVDDFLTEEGASKRPQ